MQQVYYTLFPSDAEKLSDGYSYKYELPTEFFVSKLKRQIIVEDYQFWEYTSDGENDIKYYEARSGISLYGDFADESISVKSYGDKVSQNLNFIGLSNNDGTWIKQKVFNFNRRQKFITIHFKDLLGNNLSNVDEDGKPKFLFCVVLKLIY